MFFCFFSQNKQTNVQKITKKKHKTLQKKSTDRHKHSQKNKHTKIIQQNSESLVAGGIVADTGMLIGIIVAGVAMLLCCGLLLVFYRRKVEF